MRHYVYRHIRLDTNTPFYIGKGVERRAFRLSIRNQYHKNIVNKHGCKVEIIKYFKTHEEALDFEKRLIQVYLDNNIKLCNMTLGGEGQIIKRAPLSEGTKQKISNKLKGRTLPQETKDKMAKRTGTKNPMFKGLYITPYGIFESLAHAESETGIKAGTVYQRCKMSKSTKFLEWRFE